MLEVGYAIPVKVMGRSDPLELCLTTPVEMGRATRLEIGLRHGPVTRFVKPLNIGCSSPDQMRQFKLPK